MSAPFPFARSFEIDERRMAPIETREATLTLSEHGRIVAQAVAAAEASGHARGVAETEADATARLALAVQQLADSMAALRHRLGAIETAAAGEAVAFALAFAGRVAGAALERWPLDTIEEAARSVFADLRGMPHVALTVSQDLVEATRDRLQAVVREAGLETRLVILGDPGTDSGDVTIEWADGGLVRDRAATEAALRAVAAALLARA